MKKNLLLFIFFMIGQCTISLGQLMISEMCDPSNDYENDRYIEIYNPTSCTIDLTGWRLDARTNVGHPSVEDMYTWNLSGSINPGEAMVCGYHSPIAAGLSGNIDFPSTPGDQWECFAFTVCFNWNGQQRDGAQLRDPSGTVVDFAVHSTTNVSSGLYANASYVRNAAVCQPSPIYNAAEWTSTGVATAGTGASTPGTHIGSAYCGGTAGLWTGASTTDWFDCANWSDFNVPGITTAVTIDQTAQRNCVIGGAGFALCNSLSIGSNNGTTNNLEISGASSLTVLTNINIQKTAGGGNLTMELLGGSSFSCLNLTLTGTAQGAENAEVVIEDATSVGSVSGNFTNNAGGSLDMDIGGAPTGNFYLEGDWISNGLATDFKQAGSTVNFIGSNIQDINTNAFVEVFHDININKSAGVVLLFDDIETDATGTLNLTDDQLVLNSNTVTIQNEAISAIQQTSNGSIVSETTDNLSRVRWNIGNSGGAHVFPFAHGFGGAYIPFTFQRTAGNAGMVTLATYGTGQDNLPWPNGPVDVVNNLNSVIGLTPDGRDATVDRFWQIDVTGTPTADITFTYDPAELPIGPWNTPAGLVAQRYDTGSDNWQAPTAGQSAGANFVTVTGVNTFSPWTLAPTVTLLPVELVNFDGSRLQDDVQLQWMTASEINNDYFTIERSADGINFQAIGQIDGAGTYNGNLNYEFLDESPSAGINYYRLKVTDFDGSYAYTRIIAVEYDKYIRPTIAIYPNPLQTNNRQLTIESNVQVDQVTIFNTIGQSVATYNNIGGHIQLPNTLTAGIYLVQLEAAGNTVTKKLVVE